MKIKFLPQLLTELKRSQNPPKLKPNKEYKVLDSVEEKDGYLLKIKDDIFNPLWIPDSEEGILFEFVEEGDRTED